jgi:hypothetical protein
LFWLAVSGVFNCLHVANKRHVKDLIMLSGVQVIGSEKTSGIERYVWHLAEWSERCVSILKITGSKPSGDSELTFHSDLLLTARGGSM